MESLAAEAADRKAKPGRLLPFSPIRISVPVGSGSPVHSCACLERENNVCWRASCYSAAIKMKRQLSTFPFPLYLLVLNHLHQIWLRQQTHKTKLFASGTGNFAWTGGYFQQNFTWRVNHPPSRAGHQPSLSNTCWTNYFYWEFPLKKCIWKKDFTRKNLTFEKTRSSAAYSKKSNFVLKTIQFHWNQFYLLI